MKKATICPICQSKNIHKSFDAKDHFLSQEEFAIGQCEDCGTLFTNPRPEDKNLGKYYDSPDYLSHDTSHSGAIGKLYQTLRQINIKRKYKIVSQYVPAGKILDIGCGTGELLHFFYKKHWDCLGIEPNASARKFAKSHYKIEVEEEKSLKTLPATSFDIISMWHVLEHVPDVNQRIVEIKRILKEEGYLIIALPNPISWDANYYHAYWAGFDVPRHLYHFSPEAFAKLAKAHGLQIVKTLPLKFDAFYVSLLSERYKRSSFPLLNASYNGLRSNWKAKKTGNYSSLIYVLHKNQ